MTKQRYELAQGFVQAGIAMGLYADVFNLFNLTIFFRIWIAIWPFLFLAGAYVEKWEPTYTKIYGTA